MATTEHGAIAGQTSIEIKKDSTCIYAGQWVTVYRRRMRGEQVTWYQVGRSGRVLAWVSIDDVVSHEERDHAD